MLVYPKPGVLVRDPAKKDLLPADGRPVADDDLYWVRRIADGDVTTEPPAASSSSPRVTSKAAPPSTTDPANGSNDA
jgi:hypothetical protein